MTFLREISKNLGRKLVLITMTLQPNVTILHTDFGMQIAWPDSEVTARHCVTHKSNSLLVVRFCEAVAINFK